MSPVWMMKSGFSGSALILAIASPRVMRVSGFAGFMKPTWLSEICTKLKGLTAVAPSARSTSIALGRPALSDQSRPVPPQVMHLSSPRRPIPSSEPSSRSPSSIEPLPAPIALQRSRPARGRVYSRRARETARSP